MRQPNINEFTTTFLSVADGTRQVSTYGTAVTPAQNAYGSYAQVFSGANVTSECYEIEIHVAQVSTGGGAARDCLITIGFDLAGGTSYTDKITDLVCGPASRGGGGDGKGAVAFIFPLRVPSGCSVGAKASVNSATLTAVRVWCVLRGGPTRPDLIWYGDTVTTFGSNTATSAGTTITPGTGSEGAYAQIGTAIAGAPICYWEFGYGINDSTMNQQYLAVDIAIGNASNKRIIISNAEVIGDLTESLNKPAQGRYAYGAIGDLVYARAQASNGLDDNNSVAVYGVS